MKKKGIAATYQFPGPNPKVAVDEFNKLQTTGQFDTVLVIFQSDTTKIDKTTTKSLIPIPTPYGSVDIKQTKLLIKQEFKFRFYEKSNSVLFWDAMLNFIC